MLCLITIFWCLCTVIWSTVRQTLKTGKTARGRHLEHWCQEHWEQDRQTENCFERPGALTCEWKSFALCTADFRSATTHVQECMGSVHKHNESPITKLQNILTDIDVSNIYLSITETSESITLWLGSGLGILLIYFEMFWLCHKSSSAYRWGWSL